MLQLLTTDRLLLMLYELDLLPGSWLQIGPHIFPRTGVLVDESKNYFRVQHLLIEAWLLRQMLRFLKRHNLSTAFMCRYNMIKTNRKQSSLLNKQSVQCPVIN